MQLCLLECLELSFAPEQPSCTSTPRVPLQARAPPPELWCSHPDTSLVNAAAARAQALTQAWYRHGSLLHTARQRTQLFFPDRRLIQFDCGKLQARGLLGCGGCGVLPSTRCTRATPKHCLPKLAAP